MKGLSLLIESAESLPFLGFYSEPQAYCVIKYKTQRKVSSISKIGRNPFWMFQTELNLLQVSKDLPIQVYIYNSNSNAEDQLLGWAHILPSTMSFITLTKIKYQLHNLEGHRINSFVNISSKRLPHVQTGYFTNKQCIKAEILNYVQIEKEDFSAVNIVSTIVKFQYGNFVTGLKYGQRNHITFPYNNLDEILISLESLENVKNQQSLAMTFNVKNLKEKEPQFFKFRFFDPIFPQLNYVACLVFTVISNSNLPDQYSSMQISLESDLKDNFFLRINSPLQTVIIKSLGNGKSFKLPNSHSSVTLDYFDAQKIDQKDLSKQSDEESIIKHLAKYHPIQSTEIQFNQLQWSSIYGSEFLWPIKKEKITKNLTIKFQALKQLKFGIKQIQPVSFVTSSIHERTIKLKQIKISSCYFYEVLPLESQLQIYHVDFYGNVMNFGSFTMKPNQSEYIVESRAILPNQGGELVFVCFQLYLKDDNLKEKAVANSKQFLENHMIFKVKTQKDKDIMSGKIIYNQYFISFAKKVSLTKLCKKFQQAVHNEALSIQPKFQLWMPFKKGLLELVNCQFSGFQSFNSIELIAGSNTKKFECFGEQFLCQKSSFFYVENEKITLNIITNGIKTSVHYAFVQIFGNPENTMNEVKTYLRQIEIKGGKLKIWFKFTLLDDNFQEKEINLLGDQRLSQCSPIIPIKLGPKKFTILKKEGKDILGINPQNQLSLKIRMTHQSGHYESLAEKSCTGSFYFDPKFNHILTRASTNDEGKYVFISAQISETKSKLTQNQNKDLSDENQKEQRFYNSVIDITKILGKGSIEVKFFDNKTGKLEIIGQFEVLSQNILKNQLPLIEIQSKIPKLCLKLNSVKLTNNLKFLSNFTGYHQQGLLKSIYSYFIMFIVNGSYYSLIALDSNTKSCQKSSLQTKQFIKNQFLLIDSRSIVEVKVISKLKKIEVKQLHQKILELESQMFKVNSDSMKQKLSELQVEVIGGKTLTFAELYCKQENKQLFLQTDVTFYGNRQLLSKYSNEQNSIIKNSANFTLTFDIINNQNPKEQFFEIQQNVKYTQISVLKHCVGILKINFIKPKNIDSLREILNGELILSVNSQEINYLPLNNLIQSTVAVLIERFELKFSLSSKRNPQIIEKKIFLPSYLKTNQLWHYKVDIGNFIVSFSIECFSNGLTTFSQGRLVLKDLSILNGKVDKIKLNYPVQQNTQLSYFSSEKNVTGGKFIFNSEIEIQRKMKKILKGALFFEIFIESEKRKIMAKIYLCQLSISTKINQESSGTIKMSFEDQIKIFGDKNLISLSVSGQYEVQKSDSLKQSKKIIKYSLIGEKQAQVQIPQSILNREIPINQSSVKGQNMIPSRQNGVKLQLQLPQKFILYLQQTNRQFILQNITIQGVNKDEVFTLMKSKQKYNIYYKYLDRLIIVKSLRFMEFNESVKKGQKKFKIEMLNINQVKNSTKPVYKFILNQNPEFILIVSQSSYQIPKTIKMDKRLQSQNQESLIIQISVHRLLAMSIFDRLLKKTQSNEKELSSQQKRLLSLKNSPNDEILTNKFCLYFKHGRQEQILFGIDLEGNLTNPQASSSLIKFGYDAEDDEIDIFLCVENFWNKTQYNKLSGGNTGFFVQKYSYDEIERKWISIMPLNHYLIKISEIKKNNINFSSIMKSFQYSLTQISLAKELYQRFQTKDVAFLGSFSFQQGYWGSLIVKINKIGPINFKSDLLSSKNKNKIPKILCFMKISIQHQKVILKESNTEALQWIQGQYLSFKTFLSHMFLQSKEQSQKKYLKFEMFLISLHSSTQKVFEKRYPLQDILSHELRNERVNISISQSDTNKLTEHFQMQVLFSNTKEFRNQTVFSSDTFDQNNLIETSNQNVQQIDMVSYKDKSFIDILKMILSTNDRTHFQGYFNQVKESFIYEEITFDKVQSPFGILIILLPYLKTNAKFCFIDILEMLEIAITKNQLVIKNLDQIKAETNEPFLYSLFESIMQKDNKEDFLQKEVNPQFVSATDNLISTFNEVKGKQTNVPFEKFFTKSNIQKLTSCIEIHSNLFNSKNISENYLSQDVMKLMFSIISQIIEHSENFLQAMCQNIDQWIEFAAYKSLPILTKMIQVIDKINLVHQTLISQQTTQKLMRILLDRQVQIDTIYQYWLRLSDFSKSQCFQEILSKYYLAENKKQQQEGQIPNLEIEEIKRTKILRLFYAYLSKSLKRVAKSQNASRISQYGYQKQSEKGSIISKAMYAIDLSPNLIEKYQSLFENALLKNGNVLLLNAIVELIITWKELKALKEERVTFFLSLSKKHLEKDKKKPIKPGTQPNFNKMFIKQKTDLYDEQGQNLILNEKNKKSILENLIKALTGKQKPNPVLKQKNQTDKNSQGFSKYSKYLITR